MFDQNQLAQVQAWTSIVQAIAAVVIGAAAAGISIVSYRESQRSTKQNFDRELRTAWMLVDQVALSDGNLLRVAEAVMYPSASGESSIAKLQKKWFSYLMLNPLSVTYFGLQKGLLDEEVKQGFEYELMSMLRDPEVYALTQTGLYGEFGEECKRLRGRSLAR